jgi:hypothetical protein
MTIEADVRLGLNDKRYRPIIAGSKITATPDSRMSPDWIVKIRRSTRSIDTAMSIHPVTRCQLMLTSARPRRMWLAHPAIAHGMVPFEIPPIASSLLMIYASV